MSEVLVVYIWQSDCYGGEMNRSDLCVNTETPIKWIVELKNILVCAVYF